MFKTLFIKFHSLLQVFSTIMTAPVRCEQHMFKPMATAECHELTQNPLGQFQNE